MRQLPPNGVFVFAGHFLDERQETDRLPVDRRMADRYTTLFHHLLEMPATQRVRHVPADADQNHVSRKTHPFEVKHLGSSWIGAPQLI